MTTAPVVTEANDLPHTTRVRREADVLANVQAIAADFATQRRELAEAALTRLSRVIGGGSYARSSPFGHWAQNVRGLGFLRPAWGLAFDSALNSSLAGLV